MLLFSIILDSTPMIVFLSIAIASFVFVCGSFLLGHDHDGEVDHDSGGADHDLSTLSLFSSKVLAIFSLAFGAGGSIASIYGLNVLWATLIGLVCGAVLGLTAYLALKLLYLQQVNSMVSDSSLLGCIGHVVTRIPEHGCGEVTFISQGQSLTQLAASAHHVELKAGTRVKIVSVGGNALQVETASL